MSNITEALNQRTFLFPRADFVSDGQKQIVETIMTVHGVQPLDKVKLIDENDDYDSFLIESGNLAFCLKMSFDKVPIFYEFLILKGIEQLSISPKPIERNEILIGDRIIYYTIQTFEYSENLLSLGNSSILENEYQAFDVRIKALHTVDVPLNAHKNLDNTESYLQYQKIIFENISSYVDQNEIEDFKFIKKLHEDVFNEMFSFYMKNKLKFQTKKLVHGNLSSSTIISNSFDFKFINFENAFIGSPFFDLANLVFELHMSGIKEFDFITKKIKLYEITDNRLKAGKFLEEYKLCKYIWTRKKFLDIIAQYIKEVIILNKNRREKLVKMANNFSTHFYRFDDIEAFYLNRDAFVSKFSELILS
jgi:hypothetical protein